jgi:hypothetical protein
MKYIILIAFLAAGCGSQPSRMSCPDIEKIRILDLKDSSYRQLLRPHLDHLQFSNGRVCVRSILLLGELLRREKKKDSALFYFKKGYYFDSTNATFPFEIGVIFESSKRFDSSIRYYTLGCQRPDRL